MPYNLWPSQIRSVAMLRERYKAGRKSLILVVPTGGGKTTTACHIIESLVARGNKAVFLAHREELIDQCSRKLEENGIPHGVVKSGHHRVRPWEPVQVCSVPTLVNRLSVPDAQLVVQDECFAPSTLVGATRIAEIRPGDKVPSFDEATRCAVMATVTNVFRKKPYGLLSIEAGHVTVNCTPNHLLFTRDGWRRADEITVYDELLSLLDSVPGHKGNQALLPCSDRESVLLDGMQLRSSRGVEFAYDGEHKQNICLVTNENEQSDAAGGRSEVGVENVARDWAQTQGHGREREGAIGPTEGSFRTPRGRMGDRVRGENETKRAASLLHDRHSESFAEDRDRSRWGQSPCLSRESKGPEKNRILGWSRVDRIKVLEPGGDGRFGGLCPDGLVYDLEIAGTHTYIANGIVAHNCHHVPSETFAKTIARFNGARVLGLTATPYRLDGRGLGEWFEEIVIGASTRELVEGGYLVRPRIFSANGPSLKGVRKTAGEFNRADLERVTNKASLIGDLVKTYKEHADGRYFVGFATSIAHAKACAERFAAAGYAVAVVYSGMPDNERREILRKFKSHEITGIWSVDILSEGYDAPWASCGIIARSTASMARFRQMYGRLVRRFDGEYGIGMSGPKPDTVILDHASNCERHLPTGDYLDDPEFSLDGVEKLPAEKVKGFRTCPQCFAIAASGTTACPECGYIFPVKKRVVIEKVGELREWRKESLRALPTERKVSILAKFIREAEDRAHHPFAPYAKYIGMFGAKPSDEEKEAAIAEAKKKYDESPHG